MDNPTFFGFLTNGLIEIISLNSLFLINFGQLMKVFNDKVIQIWLIMLQLFGPFNDPYQALIQNNPGGGGLGEGGWGEGGEGHWFMPPPPAFSYSGRNISLFRGKVVV